MSVARAQREISSEEFAEWMQYEQEDPGEPERSDWRAALVACTVANSMRAKGPPMQPKDFLLKFTRPADDRDVRSKWEGFARMMGLKPVKKG